PAYQVGRLPLQHGGVSVQSAQWESNPHIRHGEATGSRYIMGASRSRASGGGRTRDAALGGRHVATTPRTRSARAAGFEPTPTELETVVLPLHYAPVSMMVTHHRRRFVIHTSPVPQYPARESNPPGRLERPPTSPEVERG